MRSTLLRAPVFTGPAAVGAAKNSCLLPLQLGSTSMAKLLAVFLVASLAIVHASVVTQCYTCMGYDSSLPYNNLTNNPYCVSESFEASKVPKRDSPSGFCAAEAVRAENVGEWTARGGIQVLSSRDNYIYDASYVCKGNLCNDKPISSAGTPVHLLPLLLIPVAMSRLLA
nr:uncharacterized protein LOC113800749 [Penaeus vannamei]